MLIALRTPAQEFSTKPLGLQDRVERYCMLLRARNALLKHVAESDDWRLYLADASGAG